MLNKQREEEILTILKGAEGFVPVQKLCDVLYASPSSIRRDLKELERRGLIKRSYGGAAFLGNYSGIGSFNSRTRQNVEAKTDIARKAARLVRDGAVIFLDQSTTCFYLAKELMDRASLTVVTNNIEIMLLLSATPIHVIASGGSLSSENRNCLIGGDAQSTFRGIYADMAFFSVKALSGDGEVTDCDREEVLVRNEMLRNARERVLLCDSTKFDRRAPFRQCHLSEVDILISEGDRAQELAGCTDSIKWM